MQVENNEQNTTPYNFDALKKFNPALCYAYEPETDYRIYRNSDEINYYQLLKGYVAQQLDMFEALMYAEHTLLPLFEHGFSDLNANQLIDIIKSIHQKVAKTLLSFYDMTSGQYATTTIIRWNSTYGILNKPICDFLNKKTPDLSCEQFCKKYAKELDIDVLRLMLFMDLMIFIKDSDTIQPDARFLRRTDPSSQTSIETFCKLQVAYHTGLLTSQQKDVIDQFMKICILPDQIDSSMNDYAHNVLIKLRTCDVTNIDEISNTLSEIFYGLVHIIHPFVNGNARTATIFINLLLCAMGKSSILLRYPGENANRNHSIYHKASDVLKETRLPFATLIKNALTTDRYYNEVAQKNTLLKYTLLRELQWVECEFGLASAEETLKKIVDVFLEPAECSQQERELIFAEFALKALSLMRANWRLQIIS